MLNYYFVLDYFLEEKRTYQTSYHVGFQNHVCFMFTNLLLTCLILKQRKETIFGLNREKLGTITIMYHNGETR